MVYITGDTHGEVRRLKLFCCFNSMQRTEDDEDLIIILGDAGYNYYGNNEDKVRKEQLTRYGKAFGATYLCIHGNHEIRPSTIPTYIETEWNGRIVYREEKYPKVLFAKDGEIYNINGKQCIAIGGAYSVDKFYRLNRGWRWWPDEQPSDEIKAYVERQLADRGNKIDVVLSHTCPLKYEPTEAFLDVVDQSTVDGSTENWLDEIERCITYDKWYCGHYHIEKHIDRMQFLYKSIIPFGTFL